MTGNPTGYFAVSSCPERLSRLGARVQAPSDHRRVIGPPKSACREVLKEFFRQDVRPVSLVKVAVSGDRARPQTGRANGSKTTSAAFKADFSLLPTVEADGRTRPPADPHFGNFGNRLPSTWKKDPRALRARVPEA